jgi:phosphonate transport system substrate-binding protein
MDCLKIASCMAENTEPFCQSVAEYIHAKVRLSTQYVADMPWQERERLFDAGRIHILWLCGLPYIEKSRRADVKMELLAVPVPTGLRYGGRPVYFSDVVVKRDSPFNSFEHLRGATWAYNEPRSHSGYNVVRAHLAFRGEGPGFFREVIESGAHRVSLDLVLASRVDASAIDSTVMDWIRAERPEVNDQIRVIESLGPSPIPPWVMSTGLSADIRRRLRSLLLGMHHDKVGRDILKLGSISRFLPSKDADYDPIRRMALAAEPVPLRSFGKGQ